MAPIVGGEVAQWSGGEMASIVGGGEATQWWRT
jgi:hypothetical protein